MCLDIYRNDRDLSLLPTEPSLLLQPHHLSYFQNRLSISPTYLSIYLILSNYLKEIKIHFVYPLLYTLWILYDSWQILTDLIRHPAGVCAARVAKVRGKDGKSARWSDQFCFLSEPASLCWRCNAVSAPHTTHLTSGAGGGWGMSVLGRSPSSVSSCCVSVKPSWPKTSVEHSPYKRWSNEPSFGKGWALQVKHLHAGKR